MPAIARDSPKEGRWREFGRDSRCRTLATRSGNPKGTICRAASAQVVKSGGNGSTASTETETAAYNNEGHGATRRGL